MTNKTKMNMTMYKKKEMINLQEVVAFPADVAATYSIFVVRCNPDKHV